MKSILNLFVELAVLFNVMSADAQTVTSEVYKKTPTRDLAIKIYTPEGLKSGEKRPAIVFFFGGGWNSRFIEQFERHAKLLSTKGMVSCIADYRVKNTDNVIPKVCLSDAKSAMRYIYSNADRLNIDITKIAASGGSAGGHLAAATCYCPGFDDSEDDTTVSCRPSALVLFNPVVDNSKKGYGYERIKSYFPDFSPSHNIKNPVPTIFFVGSKDNYIPPVLAKKYQKECQHKGGRCDLHIFAGRKHGFFNNDDDYKLTMNLTLEFLLSIGYIKSL